MGIARTAVVFLLIAALLAACGGTAPPSPTLPEGQPTVVIQSPVNGAPAPVGQPLVVTALAADVVGVSRVDLRVGGIVVDSASAGEPQTDYLAEMSWTPTADGAVTLEVVAYREDGTASAPATVQVAIVLPGETPLPRESPLPGGPTPTAAARPTLPPFATPTAEPEPTPTPTPTPSPSPTPSPTPIEIDMELTVDEHQFPLTWETGESYMLTATVTNHGPGDAPPMELRVRLCNPGGGGCGAGDAFESVMTDPLGPGDSTDYTVSITPQVPGDRELRFRLFLPEGYVDPTPDDLMLDFPIMVQLGPG